MGASLSRAGTSYCIIGVFRRPPQKDAFLRLERCAHIDHHHSCRWREPKFIFAFEIFSQNSLQVSKRSLLQVAPKIPSSFACFMRASSNLTSKLQRRNALSGFPDAIIPGKQSLHTIPCRHASPNSWVK